MTCLKFEQAGNKTEQTDADQRSSARASLRYVADPGRSAKNMNTSQIVTLVIIAIVASIIFVSCNKNKDSRRVSGKVAQSLASECQTYLDLGPPKHLSEYVPGSLTESVIAHGAQNKPLDPELAEIAMLILMESESLDSIEDNEIKTYMKKGADLVSRILESQAK